MSENQTEARWIDTIVKTWGNVSPRVGVGIGDDAAVAAPPRGKLVTTVDTLVEGTHFDLTYSDPFSLGHKLLAVSLSDIAAMGARPLYALSSLVLSPETEISFAEPFYRGMKMLAEQFDVDLIGGNLTRSNGPLVLDLCLIAETGEGDKRSFLRNAVRPGDVVAVTGSLGAAAAGLACLQGLGRSCEARFPRLVKAHLFPNPRVKQAWALNDSGAVAAAIDVSDGLASELAHLANASSVGFCIDEKRLVVEDDVRAAASLFGADPMRWIFSGGEDYELLFTFPPAKLDAVKACGVPFEVIGDATSRAGKLERLTAAGAMPLEARGWDHLRRP